MWQLQEQPFWTPKILWNSNQNLRTFVYICLQSSFAATVPGGKWVGPSVDPAGCWNCPQYQRAKADPGSSFTCTGEGPGKPPKLQFLGADGGLAFVEVLRVERGDGEKKAVALTIFHQFFRVSQPSMISPSLRWIQPEGPQEDLVSLANCTSEVRTFWRLERCLLPWWSYRFHEQEKMNETCQDMSSISALWATTTGWLKEAAT